MDHVGPKTFGLFEYNFVLLFHSGWLEGVKKKIFLTNIDHIIL